LNGDRAPRGTHWVAGAAVWAAAWLSGCGASGPPAHTCITDQQFCQLKTGTTTATDVSHALGTPQMSEAVMGGGEQWTYVCQDTAQATDRVELSFNGDGILQGVSAQRSGPGTMPVPGC